MAKTLILTSFFIITFLNTFVSSSLLGHVESQSTPVKRGEIPDILLPASHAQHRTRANAFQKSRTFVYLSSLTLNYCTISQTYQQSLFFSFYQYIFRFCATRIWDSKILEQMGGEKELDAGFDWALDGQNDGKKIQPDTIPKYPQGGSSDQCSAPDPEEYDDPTEPCCPTASKEGSTKTIDRKAMIDKPTCKNEDGDYVDWYIVYKFPKNPLDEANNTVPTDGYRYAFITRETNPDGWTYSRKGINDKDSIFARTLEHLFDPNKKAESIYVVYNDQPNGAGHAAGTYAHAKGFMMMGKETGFWLLHTVPGFNPVNSWRYATKTPTNGQTAICISFDTMSQGANMLEILSRVRPYIVSSSGNPLNPFQGTLLYTGLGMKAYHDYLLLTSGIPPNNEHYNGNVLIQGIRSIGNQFFTVFAQPVCFNEDLYWIILKHYEKSLEVQTWQHYWSQRNEPSLFNNRGRDIFLYNVGFTKLSYRWDPSGQNISGTLHWRFTVDHAKWAASVDDDAYHFCLGDMNRHKNQDRRGGSIICIENKQMSMTGKQLTMDHDVDADVRPSQEPKGDKICLLPPAVAPQDLDFSFLDDDGIETQIKPSTGNVNQILQIQTPPRRGVFHDYPHSMEDTISLVMSFHELIGSM